MKPLIELMPPAADYDYNMRCPAHPRHWVQDTGDWDDTSDFCGCCIGECENYMCGHPV